MPYHSLSPLHFVQEHLQEVLPSILDGLADEAEGVRDAALAAGRTFVDLYAETALPLLLPAVEDGILNDNWRIRQSSVELLGQLLFKASPSIFVHPHLMHECEGSNVTMLPTSQQLEHVLSSLVRVRCLMLLLNRFGESTWHSCQRVLRLNLSCSRGTFEKMLSWTKELDTMEFYFMLFATPTTMPRILDSYNIDRV